MNNQAWQEPIAIIGMAARLPGAAELTEYWANLVAGVESIEFLTDEQLLAAGVSEQALADPNYVKAVASAPDLAAFDAEFFGLSPREAVACDPQLRLFLECAHAAVEDAGYDVEQLSEVGVFGAAGANRYLELVRGLGTDSGQLSPAEANATDNLAPLVSYKLGLRGPSLTVAAGTASSLVAVHLAVASLRAGECQLALAGGVDVAAALGHGYRWQPGLLSQDGHSRPFDKTATGTVPADGVAVVLLKPLSAAVADGDRIWAVLRGTAVTNDGADRESFGSSTGTGQVAAIGQALELAGVPPVEVGLIEVPAAGTVAGDGTQLSALLAGYTDPAGADAVHLLTSVTGNIGHLEHAAGIASLIKVALSLHHETIPGTIGYQDPNPALEQAGPALQVTGQSIGWPHQPDRPRIAAVHAASFGGTNAHAILTEAPAVEELTEPAEDRPRIVVWSGRTAEAAEAYRARLATHFGAAATQTRSGFASSVSTLQRGRTAHRHRGAVVAGTAREAAGLLRDTGLAGGPVPDRAGRIAFLFPGQGTQHVRIAQDLYDRSPAYAAAFDECLELFEATGVPLRELWQQADETQLNDPVVAQPLIFSVEYSLAQAWQAWGIVPSAVVGHSLGEITAATVAGIFTLHDAVKVVTIRSQALQYAPPGGMIAVAAPEHEVRPYLTDEVRIAVINGPTQVVVAGPVGATAEVGAAMERAGLNCRQVRTSYASHVPIAAPAVPVLDQAVRAVRRSAPRIDFYSAAAGRLATADEVIDPGFWSSQLVKPVLFGVAMDALTARDDRLVLIEVGPGRALTAVLRQHPSVLAGRHQVVPTLAQRRTEPLAEVRSALAAVAGVWTEGHPVNWPAVEDLAEFRRTSVPGYPYARTRYWAEQALSPDGLEPADLSPFSTLSWREKDRTGPAAGTDQELALTLLPADPQWQGAVTEALRRAGLRVLPVVVGPEYAENTDGFTVRVERPDDLAQVLQAVRRRGLTADLLVHAGTLGRSEEPVAEQLQAGFGAGAELVRQATRAAGSGTRPTLLVLTERAVDVSGSDPHRPGYAALIGLVRTVPAEGVVERAKLIDLGAGVSGADLAAELRDRGSDRVVALRGDRRWVPVELPLELPVSPDVPLRPGGVYLITGGTGALGGVLARTLAGTGTSPVLVLTGRTGAPAPELLAELERLGATVQISTGQAEDKQGLAALVDQVTRRHGPVTGVFHLAGTLGSGMVAFSSAEQATSTLAGKVLGAVALAEVFTDRPPLELFVAFSSRAALEGVAGGADYAAASAALDAVVRSGLPPADRLLSIDWPRWRGEGLAGPDDPARGLPMEQGVQLLLRLLAARTGRQVAVRHYLDGRPSSTPAPTRPVERPQQAVEESVPGGAEPAGTIDRLRALWRGLLGPIDIPSDADFFDLGGNSLSAVELMTRVRAEFGVEIGIVALFDHPTLDALAVEVDQREGR
jgi:phthiocerol/phenolphthiocerol synthesis type-I polyketide synthase E